VPVSVSNNWGEKRGKNKCFVVLDPLMLEFLCIDYWKKKKGIIEILVWHED
jgi:aminopeptidase C